MIFTEYFSAEGILKIVPAGETALPRTESTSRENVDASGKVRIRENIYMNGAEIFSVALRVVPDLVKRTQQKNEVSLNDIDFVLFHQANRYILEALRDKMEVSTEKFFIDMEETDNTVSATIPIALQNAMEKDLFRKGSKVLLVGF